jgi:Mce-associated membrane protein
MATGSRPPKRPVVGSRNPTGRPRKVAGQRDVPAAGDASPPETETSHEPPVGPPDEPPPEPPEPEEPDEPDEPDEPEAPARGRFLGNRRTTVGLLVALVVLAGVLALEIWYVAVDDGPTPSASRPVVTGEIAHRAAVDAAAQSTTEILSYKYQDFDAEIEDATSTMTEPFAKEYRDTAAAVRQEFIENKTEQDVKVVGQSVVQASSEQVQALLFLDQYVVRAGQGTNVTPYRALVTMVHTDKGWLVSDIETK